MAKLFTWVGETTWTRSFGTQASMVLEKGKSYEVSMIPPAVLAEWVKTGHATLSAKAEKKEEPNG